MFDTKKRVDFCDSDPAGILFFGNIYKYAHTAYEEMLEQACMERNYFDDPEYAIPIIHSDCDFFRPIRSGTKLKITVSVTGLRDSSFELSYTFKDENDIIRAKVKTVHVFVQIASWKKAPLTDEMRTLLEKNR